MGARVEAVIGNGPKGITRKIIAERVTTIGSGLQELSFDAAVSALSDEQEASKRRLTSDLKVYNEIDLRALLLEEQAGRSLLFADRPSSLTAPVLSKAKEQGLSFLAVPIFPIETAKGILEEMNSKPESLLKKLYNHYLGAAVNGAVPINMTGHYSLVDAPGPKTKLSESLGLEDLSLVAPEQIREAIKKNGRAALKGLGIDSGAYVDVITAEEVMMSRAMGVYVDGFTSTAIRGTDDYITFVDDGIAFRKPTDEGVNPRLVIRFGKPIMSPFYLNPPPRVAA